MPHLRDNDNCSTVSTTVSSRISSNDEDDQEEENVEEREKEFVSVRVKSDVVESEEENDDGDELVNTFNCDEEDDVPGKIGVKSTKDGSKILNKAIGVKGKRRSAMTPQKRRDRDRERKRESRLREKQRKECLDEDPSPTAFFEDENTQEEEYDDDREPPEMKFVPVQVKTEILEEEGGCSGSEVDQFLNTSLNNSSVSGANGDDEDNGAMRGVESQRISTRRRSKRLNLMVEDGADGDNGDNDYDPNNEDDEEDWGGSRKKGKGGSSGGRKSNVVKRQPSKIASTTTPTRKATPRPRMSLEKRRERDKERKRLSRLKEKQMREEVERDEDKASKKREGEERRKKRIGEMTPHDSGGTRPQREQRMLDELIKEEMGGDSEEEDADGEVDNVKKMRKSIPRGKSTSTTKRSSRRKPVSEMTDEEKEIARAKWRVQRQQERARIRSLKDSANEEERRRVEEQYRRDRERKRALRAALTPEQKREAGKKRWERVKQTPGEQERITEMNKMYRLNMPPDKKQINLEKKREAYRKRREKAKQDPEKWEKIRQKWNEYNKKRRQIVKDYCASSDDATAEEDSVRKTNPHFKAIQDQIKEGRWANGACVTEGEKKEKQSLPLKRANIRQKLKSQQIGDSGMTMEMIQEQSETPEKREQRLVKDRLNNRQRCLLRTKLKACGADEEEIERSVKEMEATFEPPVTFKPYKPLPSKRKPVDEMDLEMLGKEWVEHELKSIASTPTVNKVPSSSAAKPAVFKEVTTATASTSGPPPLKRAPRKRGSAPVNTKNNLQEQQVTNSSSVLEFAPPGGGVAVYPTQYLQSHYHTPLSQYSRQTSTPIYPYQQPQSQPRSSHTDFLQTIMAGIKPLEARSVISTTPMMMGHLVPSYQHAAGATTNAGSSHHEDNVSSYGDDSEGNDYDSTSNSPRAGDHQEYSGTSSYYNPYQ